MSENKILTADDEPIAVALHNLKRSIKAASRLTENYRPPMNGERYLTDKEVSEMLKVSRRTLQEYRTSRTLPFIIFGGKVLYREYDLQQLLEESYRKAIR
ncbi:helix-turn-helix domain protein [Bacteroides fragilis str. S24L34]|uniref:helix-turn-helix domain-containing protein n=1 Tax=Bacteroides fragilis TaxID=817 RepID=UPI0004509D29|nr:helix-turn-helix domain-containing protein [Bacteroides fragilis]EYA78601.1 helix-turn-helix domain protein [Bacteroides fragilis str. S24L34]